MAHGVRWQAERDTAVECGGDSAEGSGSIGDDSTAGAEPQMLHNPPWPHAPLYRLSEQGTYFVTAGTYRKLHHFRSPERLDGLRSGLLGVAQDFGWLV